MKPLFSTLAFVLTVTASQAVEYTNIITQEDLSGGFSTYPSTVASNGTMQSEKPVGDLGAKFVLYTQMTTTPFTSYTLDSRTVGSYFPIANVAITTEDDYAVIPRTRADRPFTVTVTLTGLLSGISDPVASKSVNLLHHYQSYGTGGTGVDVNRDNATLLTTESIATNGDTSYTYSITSVPSSDPTAVRGEERFSVYSLEDNQVTATTTYHVAAAQLASKFVQIWPVATGSITGVTSGQKVLFALPQLTVTLNDLYPDSSTYAQVYQGAAALGKTGIVVPGSALELNETVPQSRVLTLTNYDSVFDADGQWTIELVTTTPFGTERLAYVTFTLDRTIEMNGNVTTSE